MHTRILIALGVVIAAGCAFLFESFYKEAENVAIRRLNEQQFVHGHQAARGIEDFFGYWRGSLTSLAGIEEVIKGSPAGRTALQLFYEANSTQILALKRIDDKGVIVEDFPDTNAIGTDISNQKHVAELLRTHKPVVSDVFESIEGPMAVALHVPLFENGQFKGGLGILVDFRSLAKRYLDVIKIGRTGYAWVISRDGTVLYTPVPGNTGKPVLEVAKDSPSLQLIAKEMLQGREGAAQYKFDHIKEQAVAPTTKYAVYLPVRLGNTFWSICVATAEEDVLSHLAAFRRQLTLVIVFLFVSVMALSIVGSRAWLLATEEEKLRQTEAKLRESLERFRQVAENAGEFIWEVDERGLYSYASPSIEKILGYSPGELVGRKHFYDLYAPQVRKELLAAVAALVATPRSFRDFPNANLSKSGRVVELESSGSPVLDRSGKLIGYRGASTDVTGRKLAEKQIAEQRNELAHLSRVSILGELTGSIAHELNQPLTAILSNAEAARRFLAQPDPDLDEVREILDDIVADDTRAGEVIRHLRMLIRKGEVNLQPLCPNELVEEVLALLQKDLSMRGITVQFQPNPDLPPLHADRVELQQVLINLVMNACDAMGSMPRERRQLTIRVDATDDGFILFSVADRGVGIDPAKIEQVFDPFHSTKPNGVGLGLSVCRTIISAHGGRLWGGNNADHGATFQFTVPAGDNADRTSASNAAPGRLTR